MAIIDMFAKASMMPYVNCKEIVITPHPSAPDYIKNIKLKLEILQSKKNILNSTWVDNLAIGNVNFLDAMALQIVPFYRKENVLKLRAAAGSENNYSDLSYGAGIKYVEAESDGSYHDPAALNYDPSMVPADIETSTDKVPSVYLSQQFLGDGYLPRSRPFVGSGATLGFLDSDRPFEGWHPGLFVGKGPADYLAQEVAAAVGWSKKQPMNWITWPSEKPIRISMDSVLGKLSSAAEIIEGGLAQTVKEEVRHGVEYYVIPLEIDVPFYPELMKGLLANTLTSGLNEWDPGDLEHQEVIQLFNTIAMKADWDKIENLGFLFYTFLDVPYWFDNLTDVTIDSTKYANFYESLIVEGPISTELV